MKVVIILHDSFSGFMTIPKRLFQPKKYKLYTFVNDNGYRTLIDTNQLQYFEKIILTNDFSLKALTPQIQSIIADNPKFHIVTSTEDTMKICGDLRVLFKLDHQNYSRFFDKTVMKKRLKLSSVIKLPNYVDFNLEQYKTNGENYLKTLCQTLTFPLFMKPINMYSSMNLYKADNYKALKIWANSIDDHIVYEVDEYIDGTMFHCDSFIKNGKVLFTFVSQNSKPCYDFTVGKMKGTIMLPKHHPDSILLSKIAEDTLLEIGLPNAGVTHMEVIKKQNGEVYFIEVAHRQPGCLIPKMYEVTTGIDINTAHILLQVDPDYSVPSPTPTHYAAWACYPKKPGYIKKLNSLPFKLESQYEINWCVNIGDELKTYSLFGRDYTGTIFLENLNFSVLFNEFMQVNEYDLCVTSKHTELDQVEV